MTALYVLLSLFFLAVANALVNPVLGVPERADPDTLRTTSRTQFQSVALKRNALADDEFAFSFNKDASINQLDGIKTQAIAPPRHRLFGLSDVNVAIVRVFQGPGHVIPWHTHPRGSENYATISGTLRSQIKLEGIGNVRNISLILPPGHVSSIPQGLPHTVKCISKKKCVYHIFFNTADPGITPA